MAGVIALGALGFVFGLILAVASEIFKVKEDPRLQKILKVLPGANCGLCGYPGCEAYAKAILTGKAKPNLCVPGGSSVASQIAKILQEK